MPTALNITRAKHNFFDKAAVIAAMDKATLKVFNRFGSATRLTARHSIRKVSKKGTPSAPGQPPKSRTDLLRNYIFYIFSPAEKSVVIGPALFARSSWAQKTLEHGGTSRRKNRRRKFRRVGDGGEIRVFDGRSCRTTKATQTAGGEQRVTYALLTTQAQADRANRLNELLYGPDTETVTIAPRPYMQPAFETTKARLPEFWENAIVKT